MRIDFRASPAPTIGVEWELALVDRQTRDLANTAAELLASAAPRLADPTRLHKELLRNTVEVVTGICGTVAEAVADLRSTLGVVVPVADDLGVDLLGAGTHPFAKWSAQQVTEGPRYAELINRTQWWGRQMLIWGVHVHVGLPFALDTWEQFEACVDDQTTTGVVDSLSDVRWDIRPSPRLGTIENRVCDGMSDLRELAAVTALVQCLVVDLDTRVAAGETLPTMPPWHVQENKWRAARYGLDAIVILDAQSRERLVTDDLDDLLERLTPVARRLDCEAELRSVADIPRRGASYQRQRDVAARHGGDLVAVVDAVVAELRASL